MFGQLQDVSDPKSEEAQKKGMKWIKIDGHYYSWFGSVPEVSKGSLVKFEYERAEKNGKTYRNLKKLEPLNVGREVLSRKQRLIWRSVCIKAASSAQFVESEREVVELAEGLEDFLFDILEKKVRKEQKEKGQEQK